MRNPVAKVARIHNLPEADLVDFALSRDSKYGIVVEYGEATVSNFHVDQLLTDFKRQQAEDAAIMNHSLAQQFEVGCEFDPIYRAELEFESTPNSEFEETTV